MKIIDEKKIEEYYEALINKDSSYTGIFITGVKTTGIFCIPTCRARKPKKENTDFFDTIQDALRFGFRPCKICKPADNIYNPPAEITELLKAVHENNFKKISDYDIKQRGYSPETIRRWFKKHYNITFQTYLRMLRINTAFNEIREHKTVTDSAFDAGYESISGFAYTAKKLTGVSPKNAGNKHIIMLDRFLTPLGPMFAGATNEGLCLLEFTDRRMLETEFQDLQKRLNAVILYGENKHSKQAKKELHEYFSGTRKSFDVKILCPGTDFQHSVWDILKTIPYGQTWSYQQEAEILGRAKAVRAVANANGQNRLAIIIPCHRVIGKDGSLTGYAGGLDRKKSLLDMEKRYLE